MLFRSDAVFNQIDEAQIEQLIELLNKIYDISAKELEKRRNGAAGSESPWHRNIILSRQESGRAIWWCALKAGCEIPPPDCGCGR